jgi:NADP-dependent 3-hydroxy acid dehydrogenase YdfG
MPVDQQIVVVIGGSSGIGYEVARQASAQGARLIIAGRHRTQLAAAAERLGKAVTTAVLDAHDEKALSGFFAGLESVDHLAVRVPDRPRATCENPRAHEHA